MPDATPPYLFGYGSLINLDSAAKTLGRSLPRELVQPAWLDGYQRSWTVFDRATFVDGDRVGQAVHIIFLNLEPRQGATCRGVLIPLQPGDLDRFDQREKAYDRVDVTARIRPAIRSRVYTYVARADATRLPTDATVSTRYEALVADGVRSWGDAFVAEYDQTTQPHALPRFTERYTFTDRAQQAAAGRPEKYEA